MVGTQSAYARHAGISRQAVSKLVKVGKIVLNADGLIDFAEADRTRKHHSDPSRRLTANVAPTHPALSTPAPVSYANVRANHEAIKAERAKFEYETRVGLWVKRDEVREDMEDAGALIRQQLDALPNWADQLVSTARTQGTEAVRSVLKQKVREVEDMITQRLQGAYHAG